MLSIYMLLEGFFGHTLYTLVQTNCSRLELDSSMHSQSKRKSLLLYNNKDILSGVFNILTPGTSYPENLKHPLIISL